jgi:hypothetical protein
MQELFTALQMLQKGATSLATSRAIRDANEQVQQVLQTETDEAKQLATLRQVAGGLTQQLAGIGADPTTIEQVSKSIAPPQPMIQTAEQAVLMGTPEQQKRGQKLIDAELGARKAAAGAKLDSHVADKVQMAANQFTTMAKKNFEALDAAETLRTMIDNNQSLTDSVIGSFGSRATGEVGNLTKEEREMVRGRQHLIAKAERAIHMGTWGTFPEADRKELRTLADLLAKGAKRGIEKKARLKAGSTAKIYGLDPEEVFQQFIPYDLSGTGAAPKAGAAPQSMGAGGMAGSQITSGLRSFLRPKQ